MEKRIAPGAVKAQELRARLQGQPDVQSGEEVWSLSECVCSLSGCGKRRWKTNKGWREGAAAMNRAAKAKAIATGTNGAG